MIATDAPQPTASGIAHAKDGVELHWQLTSPAVAKATVVVMHGFAEHGGRYGHLVRALLPHGYAVLTFDARGHGKSGGRRVYIDRFAEYDDDLAVILALAANQAPQPLFLFGHSQGGLITLHLALRGTLPVKAVAVSNPALANKVQVPGWKSGLAKVASKYAPTLAVPAGLPPTDITRDAAEVQAYDRDPLNSKNATSRWYTEFLQAQAEVLARPEAQAVLPMLALLGTGDRIIDAAVSEQFFGQVPGGRCQTKIYAGFYHELINEPEAERNQVLGDLQRWLDAQLS
jgi:acylglycerol lipase